MTTTSVGPLVDVDTSRQLFAHLHASWEAAKDTLVDVSLRKITLHARFVYPERTLEVGQHVTCRHRDKEVSGTVVGLRNPVFGLRFGEVLLYCPEQDAAPFSVFLEEIV